MGSDVLAAGRFKNLLFAVGDAQVALGVELADVSGAEPAVFGHDLGGQVGAFVVAHHHVGSLGQDFSVGVEL